MQRKYVWKTTQVRNLIDSIYRDYPSGSILIWESNVIPVIKEHAFEKTAQSALTRQLMLLDGQQRITSLTTVLTGKTIRIKDGKTVKEKFVDVYFNVDHPEDKEILNTEDFEVGDIVEGKHEEDGDFYSCKITNIDKNRYYVVYDDGVEAWTDEVRGLGEENRRSLFFQIKNKAIESKPNWISVTRLFKEGVGMILLGLKIGADSPNYVKFNTRLNQLYNRKDYYFYPVQIIREKDYDQVTDIFIRVNSSGTSLRGSDLALAQITSGWQGSMKIFEDFLDTCIRANYYIDENFLARCLVALATKQSKFKDINRISVDKLKDTWELVKKGIENTINFLVNNALVDNSIILPSPYAMVPLIYYASKHDINKTTESEKGFLHWFYNSALWGRYSSSMESKLNQDLLVMDGDKPWNALTDLLFQTVGKGRTLQKDDVRGKSISSPIFFLMYVLARKKQAKDFETGAMINLKNVGNVNQIEYDHIFPRSKLEKFLTEKDYGDSDRKKFINEIANIGFLTKKGNIIKTNDDPSKYFPDIFNKYGGKDIFERQEITYDTNMLEYDKYFDFLNTRAGNIANSINTLLDDLKK
jgi:hypothetical protein